MSANSPSDSLRRYGRISALAGVVIVGGGLAAAMTAPLSGAVLAPGLVVVESNLRKVRHSTGGVVGRLLVVEGQRVRQGDLLLRLDDTLTRANLQIVLNELNALTARRARLQAERDDTTELFLPADFLERARADQEIARMAAGERQLLEARRATIAGRKAQLKERIDQLKEELTGIDLQLRSLRDQRSIADTELADLMDLMRRNLIQRPRVTQIQRELVRIGGSIGEMTARRAQIMGRIAETEVQILQISTDQITDVARELREVETKIGELSERKVAAEDMLSKIEVRAPISGQVHQLAVHTVGGVISPSEAIMLIVPDNDRLIVEARVSPTDIDEVRLGQETRVRFTAFSQATTRELAGSVMRIAGDLTREPQTVMMYYTVAVSISQEELDRLKHLRLMPGMPAELHLKTSDRTVASFIMKPLFDHMHRSMRES